MGVTFQGWTGDMATPLPGRQPLQALIAVEITGKSGQLADMIAVVNQTGPLSGDGTFSVAPAIAGRAPAFVTKLSWGGPLLWVVDFQVSAAGDPWPAGVNLVHIAASSFDPKLTDDERWSASTFATVIVPVTVQGQKAPAPQKAPPPPPAPAPRPRPAQRGT